MSIHKKIILPIALCMQCLINSAILENNVEFKEIIYEENIPQSACMMGADIGGTNSNFGIFMVEDGKLTLLLSIHIKSKDMTSFTDTINHILKYIKSRYGIQIKHAAFAAAGMVPPSKDFCHLTNVNLYLDAHKITRETEIEKAIIVNDFEVIGFGIDSIEQKKIIPVNNALPKENGTRAILGAGTGLGKSILYWVNNRYYALPSEGGHVDFSPQNALEFELLEFIKKSRDQNYNVSWEELLSGNGIRHIFDFFCQKNMGHYDEQLRSDPGKILNTGATNVNSLQTSSLFTKFYGQFAKNVALNALTTGGIYIAGGIAAKNIHLFAEKTFMQAFTNSLKHHSFLATIPVYVITDYNISMYGAVNFMLLEGLYHDS